MVEGSDRDFSSKLEKPDQITAIQLHEAFTNCHLLPAEQQAVPKDPLDAATQKSETEAYNLPPNASKRDLCEAKLDSDAQRARESVNKITKAVLYADRVRELKDAFIDMPNNDAFRNEVEKEVTAKLSFNGIESQWDKDSHVEILSLWRELPASSPETHLTASLTASWNRVSGSLIETNKSGQVTKVFASSPEESWDYILGNKSK